MSGKRIGELLVDLGHLTTHRLAQAEKAFNGNGLRFGEHLRELGFVGSDAVSHALAVQHGFPCRELNGHVVPPEALQCLTAELAQRYRVLPLGITDGRLELAMADPLDLQAVEDLSAISGFEIDRCYMAAGEMAEGFRRHYGTSAARMAASLAPEGGGIDAEAGEESVGRLEDLAREPSLVNLVNLIILEAINDRASDIHVEPFEKQLKVKYRIDGILHEMPPPPKRLQAAIVSRIKIMSQLNIAERFLPQDGHIEFTAPGVHVDLRVSTVPTSFGESVVMRVLDKSGTLRSLDGLGMNQGLLDIFEQGLQRPHGILLVTGPTGSGKTTTLYAGLNYIYTPTRKIITIEDPVEFHLEGINQIQVNPKRGLTFAGGLRSILRQDPDIIMVGEIRDGETADIAIRSALTGHLVLSSLHTNDASGAMTRLLDMGIEPYLLASTVEAVIAQRLVRVLCRRCSQPYQPSQALLEQLGEEAEEFRGKELRHGHGCQECHETGYLGRLGIFESIRMTDPVRELIMARANSNDIRRAAGEDFFSMREDGYRKVLAGTTTLEEVWRVTREM